MLVCLGSNDMTLFADRSKDSRVVIATPTPLRRAACSMDVNKAVSLLTALLLSVNRVVSPPRLTLLLKDIQDEA